MENGNTTKNKLIIIISILAVVSVGSLCTVMVLLNTRSAKPADTTALSTATTSYIETTAQQTITAATVPETTAPETTEEATVPTISYDTGTYINGILVVNKTYPLPESYNPGGILPEAESAFELMAHDASAEGISLKIISGFRSYEYQADLYEKYVAKDGIEVTDGYSARPGHSEHQSGLGMDINSLDRSFGKTAEGIWLAENCSRYGFVIRYPEGKEKQTGYMYEPWHIRYLGVELARAVTDSGLCLEEYLGITSTYSD